MRNLLPQLFLTAGVCAVLALSACGGAGDTKAEAPKAASGPPAVPDEANGGTITGKVDFTGPKPVLKKLDMSAVPFCARTYPYGAPSEEVVLNENGTLRNAFVWIKSGLPEKNWQVSATPVTLDQKGCIYSPHVLAVMTGQNIAMQNSDGTNHNIHPTPAANREWNESQPPGSPVKTQSFPKPELLLPIKCNIHPWMRAYVNVVDHPFFAVTGEDGTFTIKGLPAGTYTVEMVHEKYGKQEVVVTVGAKERKTADFTVKG